MNVNIYDQNKVDQLIALINSTLDEHGLKLTTIEGSYVNKNQIGANSGVASLGADGKVPSAQLPSYVDDVVEYTDKSGFPKTGEAGKIYVAKNDNKTYRWSGTAYVEISPSIALGETASTAYAGSKGKANADAIAALQELVSTINSSLSGKAPTKHDSSATTYGVGTATNYGHVKLFKLANYSEANKSNDDASVTAAFVGKLLEALHTSISSEVAETLASYTTSAAFSALQSKVTQLESKMITMVDNGDGTITLSQN